MLYFVPVLLLSLAASAEAKSEHPLGKAIVAFAKKRGIDLAESTEFKMTTGKGIYAEIEGKEIFCGNEKFLLENGVVLDSNVHSTLETIRSQGKASILVAVDEKYIGIIALSDVLRPEAANMVARLTAMQTGIVLLTGDNQKTADYLVWEVILPLKRRTLRL